jgi:hypothetical protein
VSPLDPRLERFKPALVYDPQEAYRAMSAASITDNRDNALKRENGAVVARAGSGLTLALLNAYDVKDGDRIDEAGDYLTASRRFQGNPAYRERVYGRVTEDGGRTWLQYWLWCYYNPKHLLGWGKHEGDWEMVQVGLDGDTPDVLTYSQHSHAEAREWAKARRQGDHPIVYVAPLSHACYFEPGAHPYVFGVDNPDDTLPPILPTIEEFGSWSGWTGRWGASRGVVSSGTLGGRSPASPGRQGQKWDHPAAWHARAKAAKPLRQTGRAARAVGAATYPKLTDVSARREGDRVLVDYQLDPAIQRRATRLLVTLHRAEEDDLVLASSPEQVSGTSGTVEVPVPEGVEDDLLVRASAYNPLRQRSDPLETRVE